jgi:hypothetical protein
MQFWGVCPTDVISSLESLDLCVYREVLEHQVMMVHHTSPRISQSKDQPTSINNQLGD